MKTALISIALLLTLPPALLADAPPDSAPVKAFAVQHLLDSGLTQALIVFLTAATAWLAAKNKFSKVEAKVDVKRQPPFPEEASRRFVTKEDFNSHEERNRDDVKRIFDKIDQNTEKDTEWRVGTARQLGHIDASLASINAKLAGGAQ